ncbi:hypothetical protein FKM82_003363 [Ascaphus truei]
MQKVQYRVRRLSFQRNRTVLTKAVQINVWPGGNRRVHAPPPPFQTRTITSVSDSTWDGTFRGVLSPWLPCSALHCWPHLATKGARGWLMACDLGISAEQG